MKQQGKPSMNLGTRPSDTAEITPREALEAIPGVGIQRVQTQYTTAVRVQLPRVLADVERRVLHEAALMGEDFVYAWDVENRRTGKKERIEGLSIDGATILFRNWTNCAIPTDVVEESPKHYLIKATFIDHETGTEFPRLFRQRKNQALGRMDEDRAEDIAFQIGQSKCQRNAIEKGLPYWLIDKAIQAAKEAAEKKYEDVDKWRKYIVKRATGYGITEAELEAKSGAKLADWLPRDVAYIAGSLAAIAKRESTVTVEFRTAPAPTPTPSEPSPAAEPESPEPSLPDDVPPPVTAPDPPKETSASAAAAIDASVAKALENIKADAAKAPPAAPKSEPKEEPKPDFEPPKGVK